MIVAALLAIAPAVLASSNAHGGHIHKRTGPTGTVVPSVTTNGETYYIRGCYDELKSGLMALNHDISSTLTSITVENCITGCAAAGYSIAGVMNGDQCLCDNAMSVNSPLLDAQQCDVNCTGNTTEVCGGVWHYDIYTTSPTAPIPNPVAPTTVGSGNATYTSLGCFVDNTSNRTLASAFSTSDTQTPAACAATCYAQGYRLAGVEWGIECYCGNELINANLTAITDCAQACKGDSTETCGGEAVINVYSQVTEPPATPSNPPVPAPTCGNNDNNRYLHQGCYLDNTHRRVLDQYSFTSPSMTPSTCSSKCYSMSYKYAALEGGNTCYCGNNCPNSKTSSDHCNHTCSGDRNHIGGGQSQSGCLTVYKSFTLGFPQNTWPFHGGW